jgi:hypothetical protein
MNLADMLLQLSELSQARLSSMRNVENKHDILHPAKLAQRDDAIVDVGQSEVRSRLAGPCHCARREGDSNGKKEGQKSQRAKTKHLRFLLPPFQAGFPLWITLPSHSLPLRVY